MAIHFACDNCGQKMRTGDKYSGGRVPCPNCGKRLTIPAESTTPPPVPAASPAAAAPHHAEVESEKPGELVQESEKINVEGLIDMTAMVDIVFFLLIFFLVTSMNAISTAIQLPVPSSSKATAKPQNASADSDKTEIAVHIDRNNIVSVDGVEAKSMQDVITMLRDLRHSSDTMSITGSSEAEHGTLVGVLDAGNDVGIERMRLTIREDDEAAKSQP